MIRRTFLTALSLLAIASAAKEPKSTKSKKEGNDKAIAAFFAGPVRSLELVLKPDAVEEIKSDARRYTEIQMIEDGVTHKHVGLKLKGAASFRGLH